MSTRIPIASHDDPRLAPYRELVHSRDTRPSGLFVAEGEKLVERLLASSFEAESVLVAERLAERIAATAPPHVPLYVVSASLIRDVVGYNFHRGVMACGRRRLTLSVEDLIEPPEAPRRLVICPAPNDAENLGGIIRSAAAFGVDALVISDRSLDPFSRRVLRVSMGAAFTLPIVESRDLLADVRRLQSEGGIETFATVLEEAEPLESVTPPKRWALVFGGEGDGLSSEWTSACRHRVTIPMRHGVDSLNVSVAAGIFLHRFTGDESAAGR
ncbi:MAG: RNA methyltransferase [Planctomycetes bacterium]|nr:RNA methyltransferase [Planctomycetota bacterium]